MRSWNCKTVEFNQWKLGSNSKVRCFKPVLGFLLIQSAAANQETCRCTTPKMCEAAACGWVAVQFRLPWTVCVLKTVPNLGQSRYDSRKQSQTPLLWLEGLWKAWKPWRSPLLWDERIVNNVVTAATYVNLSDFKPNTAMDNVLKLV